MVQAYGRLYNWYAVDDPRGICPPGWHVPTNDDWTDLTDYLSTIEDPGFIGDRLKSCLQNGSPVDGCNVSDHPRSFEQLFAFQVAGNIPGHHEVKFTITAFSSEDQETTWVSGFSEIAHAPYLEFLHLSVDDTAHGNADSILDPGEMAYLQVEVMNTGQLPAPPGTLTLAPTDNWLFLLEQEDQVVPALEPLETATLSFLVAAFDNTPPETIAGLELSAQLSPFSFSRTMGVGIGQVPYYSEGMIPSTYKTLITTSSSALEPGELAAHIPQGATITGVDLFYDISSHGGAQTRNQRSFLRCLSPGGQTETQVSMGAGTEGGTLQYHRKG